MKDASTKSATLPKPKRDHPVAMRVSARDRLLIEERAAAVGLSVSAFARAATLGRKVRVAGSADAVDALTRLNQQLIEASAAFRACLDRGGQESQIAAILDRIKAVQDRMAQAAARL